MAVFTGNGSATNPSFTFSADTGTNTGFFRQAEDTIGITTGGTERARFTSTGQLLIGDVDGTPEITLNASGLGEFVGGVKVSGGTSADVGTGIGLDGGLVLTAKSEDQIKLSTNGRVNITANTTADRGVVFTGESTGSSTYGLYVNTSSATSGGNHHQLRIKGDLSGTVSDYYQFYAEGPGGSGSAETVTGFYVRDTNAVGTNNNYGFSSNLSADGSKNFNFFATSDAPNYFAGNTYIGGNTTASLGDNTAINLNSSGIIQAGGYSFNANRTSKNVESRGLVYSPNRNALLTTNRPDSADDDVDVFLARVDNLKYDDSDNRVPVNVSTATSFKSEGPFGNAAGEYGIYDSYIGFRALNNGQSTQTAVWTAEDNSYGFFSGLSTTLAGRNYLTVTNAGTFTADDGNYTNVATTATSGSGDDALTVNIWVESNQVVAAAINTDGSGYADGDTISVDGYTGVELTYKTPGTAIRYNFYAEGTAPNYFSGEVRVGTSAESNDPADSTNTGTIITGGAGGLFKVGRNAATAATAIQILNRSGSTTGRILEFRQEGTFADAILLDGSGGISFGTSDYRLKENIVDLPSATDAIKTLRPVNYNFKSHPGKTRPGFIAHELQETLPIAVTGTKDEEEAIGTLADYDGTVLETEVTEPSAAELTYTEEVEVTPYVAPVEATYDEEGNELTAAVEEIEAVTQTVTRTRTWTPSGTRPVYQGVDQTKLIPLLTKALQEALERIEVLEAAVGG